MSEAITSAGGLGVELQRDYERHPAFGGDGPTFALAPELLSTFNDFYLLARDCATRLEGAAWASCQADVLAALEDVFSQLLPQAADVHEEQFLRELCSECSRLLQEELELFGRKPVVRAVSLGGAAVRRNAARLAHSRHFFGQLSAGVVAELLAIGAADLSQFRSRAREGRLRREDLSVNVGPTVQSIVQVLNREFARQGVLETVSSYMGQPMQVSGVALELSVPRASWWANSHTGLARAPRTLYAHLDESIAHPKSITYLSDVEPSNGPTSIYPGAFDALNLEPLQTLVGRVLANVGNRPQSPLYAYYSKQYHQSMSSAHFRRHFMKLPPRVRFNSHFGWDVLPDSVTEQQLARSEQFMTGPAGTYIIFDGARLLHRGGLMESGERIALQIIFTDVSLKRRIAGKLRRISSRIGKPS
jgi:hypothetical protein